eukprot:6214172-Pleurochrysis_carterae.AAC.1
MSRGEDVSGDRQWMHEAFLLAELLLMRSKQQNTPLLNNARPVLASHCVMAAVATHRCLWNCVMVTVATHRELVELCHGGCCDSPGACGTVSWWLLRLTALELCYGGCCDSPGACGTVSW